MPLSTQIIRDGEPLKLRWSGFHVAAMVYAATIDSGVGPFTDNESVQAQAAALMEKDGAIAISTRDAFDLMNYGVLAQTPLNEGPYTMSIHLVFVDVTDGERLVIEPGDQLVAYR